MKIVNRTWYVKGKLFQVLQGKLNTEQDTQKNVQNNIYKFELGSSFQTAYQVDTMNQMNTQKT